MRSAARLILVLALAVATLPACASRSEVQMGHLTLGFEVSAFLPCGSSDSWWLTGEQEVMQEIDRQYPALAGKDYQPVYVELRGVISREGSYGHLGAYHREFHATELLAIRAEGPGDCR